MPLNVSLTLHDLNVFPVDLINVENVWRKVCHDIFLVDGAGSMQRAFQCPARPAVSPAWLMHGWHRSSYIIGRLKCGVTRSHLTTEPGQSSQYLLAIRERPRAVSGLQSRRALYPRQWLERDIPFR